MKTLILISFLLFGSLSQAIECTGILYTETEVLDEAFTVTDKVNGHGGEEYTLLGKNNVIVLMADSKWLGITWYQNKVLIAKSVNLIKTGVDQPRTLIVYNPKDENEQVSIDCKR